MSIGIRMEPSRRLVHARLMIYGLLTIAFFLALSGGSEQTVDFVESGSFSVAAPHVTDTIRIVTYNVHGPLTEDVEAVFSVIESDVQLSKAHVWALQEVRTSRDRNFARYAAERLGMNYAHAIARPRGDGWEGISFLSRLPISDLERIELPHLDTGDRLRIGFFATIAAGNRMIRMCNVHLPIRMKHKKRTEQLRLILDHFERDQISNHQIIIGDFNTINGGLRRLYHTVLENSGFQTPFDGNAKTYQKYFFLRFKLDWIYLRGLEALDYGIEQRIKASDHRPVWVDVRFPLPGLRMERPSPQPPISVSG